jgi:colanic acid biosynthesis glycosyl transferase WcaI
LRVLIYGLNYAPELTGVGKYTGELASWLASQGHEVRVVTAPPYYPAWRIGAEYRGGFYRVKARATVQSRECIDVRCGFLLVRAG